MSKRAMLIGWIRFFKITGRVADSNFFIIIYLQCPEISQRIFLLHQFQFHNRFRVRKKVTKTLFRSLEIPASFIHSFVKISKKYTLSKLCLFVNWFSSKLPSFDFNGWTSRAYKGNKRASNCIKQFLWNALDINIGLTCVTMTSMVKRYSTYFYAVYISSCFRYSKL